VPLPAGAAFTVPARTKAAVLFDNGVLTTAYPELRVSGGSGTAVKLTYSESLWKQEPDGQWVKGNRDETGGKQMLGGADVFHPDGAAGRVYRPLWWRTYRYLQLDIETADEPVAVEDLKGEFTAYPFRELASIEMPDPEITRIWQTGWRTARLCAHETYMDCPYYEQMQYVGDTRVQALISLYVAGDDRLMRNAIEQFDDSRIPEGITYSRYPSNIPQFIPGFSLLWIGMLHDHWMHRGDTAFVRAHLPGAASILVWFERSADASGLAGPVAWWPFADWTRGWEHGIPPGGESGGSALFSLQRAIALREAAEMEEAAGDRARAGSYRSQSQQLVDAVRKRCWSERRGLFRDAPESDSYSQHVNVLAVLADALPAAEQRRVMEKVLSDASLPQATYYFRHYVARAANKAGLGDSYVDMLGPWREMLKIGLTTWAEKPEPARSDCHAWSASPNYELLATVAGIEPGEPGFRTVRVRPHLGRLGWVRAKMPHPKGTIEVDLRKAEGGLAGTVVLPESVRGEFVAGGQRVALAPGRNRVRE
jgi:hypothetical protein